MAEPAQLTVDDVIDGRYRILGLIGAGGMGTVYAANHLQLARRVAIKVVHPQFAREPDVMRRFRQEAMLSAQLNHPGILEVFDAQISPDQLAYIAMEFLDGEDLSGYLRRSPTGYLSVARCLDIAKDTASALQAAHAAQIIHRDLKPTNVFLLREHPTTSVKLLDFGIAKLVSQADGDATQQGAILGTPQYMSPEQMRNAAQVDVRSDMYSFGCILYEMLTGRRAFPGKTPLEVVAAHMGKRAEDPREHNPAIPHGLSEVILRCLEKDPEARFPSMTDILGVLSNIEFQVSPADAPVQGTAIKRTLEERLGGAGQRPAREPTTKLGGADITAVRAVDNPPTGFHTALGLRPSMFSKDSGELYGAVQESVKFYREHLKTEYDQLSRQIDRTHALWLVCVGLGFVVLLFGIGTMIAGRATEGLITAACSPMVYFIVRIFQQREDHYRELREKKNRHLEYGNSWLMAIQTIDGIDNAAERTRQQKRLIAVVIKGLGGRGEGRRVHAAESDEQK